MIQITDENDNSNLIIKNHDGGKNIVVLFPMTKGIDVNLIRWQKLISTVNSSRVAALVLIDKTPFRQATNYFVEKNKISISPNPFSSDFDILEILLL